MGKLFFGDNLDMLREHVKDESVDLVYLDPPFNSKAQYNVLFKSPAGIAADAQLEAFLDSWSWGEAAQDAYEQIVLAGGAPAKLIAALRSTLGEADMMAYLVMMSVRLIELRRILKPQGSLFLHCDPTASHYLKIMLDAIFGPANFRNEIIWKRTTAHNDAKNRFSDVSDAILFYGRGSNPYFAPQFGAYDEAYLSSKYRHQTPAGRRYRLSDLRSPSPRPNLTYEYKGHKPHPNGWAVSRERMQQLDLEDRLEYPRKDGGRIQLRRFLDEMKGMPVSNVWTDIRPVNSMAEERIGYPTQKPLALLQRIVAAASKPGDVLLDPFCGCGTSVHAAQSMGRDWIGIDITHHAITVIEDRLAKKFEGLKTPVEGRPRDLASARDLARRDKYQFQWWANWLFGVDQYRERKKGSDRGIDGERFFLTGPGGGVGRIIISVKGGEHVGVEAVRDLRAVLEREKAELGVLVTLAPHTRSMITEAASLGFCETQGGRFPRLQLVAVGDLFAGRRPLLPVRAPFEQLRAAVPKGRKRDDRQLAFTFALDGGKAETPSGDVVVLDPRRRASAA